MPERSIFWIQTDARSVLFYTAVLIVCTTTAIMGSSHTSRDLQLSNTRKSPMDVLSQNNRTTHHARADDFFRNKTVSWRQVNSTRGVVVIPTLFPDEYETLSPFVEKCFTENPVGLLGMSLMRYQYLSLVNFLEHGNWIPWDGSSHLDLPSPVIEKQWRREADSDTEHWNRFFRGTNRVLNSHEACDCFRSSDCTAPSTHGGWCTTENRYYRRPVDGVRNVEITFLQSYGPKFSPRGHWFIGRSQAPIIQEQQCPVGKCKPPWNWIYKDASAIAFILSRMQIRKLVYYGGQKGFDNNFFVDGEGNMPEVDDVVFAADSIRSENILYQGAYRSSHRTVDDAKDVYTDVIQKKTQAAGWANFPTMEIVKKLREAFASRYPELVVNQGSQGFEAHAAGLFFYWDDIHYYPWVYEELNKALIHIICSKG